MTLPPSMKRIKRYSNCKSLKDSFLSLIPRQIMPRAHPAASEYPSRYRHLSLLGLLPIWERVIYVMVRLQVPLCSRPMPSKALVCTLIGISTSMLGGNNAGMCKTNALERASSDLPILEALTPRRMATLVN